MQWRTLAGRPRVSQPEGVSWQVDKRGGC